MVGVLLAAVTLAVFWPVLGHDFINLDDNVYVTENHHVLGGLTWQSVLWAFTNLEAGFWQPLTWLSHMLDVTLFGLKPWGHHLTNLLLHTANTVLLFVLLRRMTGALWRSAVVAALFALHPLHVESVAWLAERKDVLSTLFWMLTLLFYARYVEESKVQSTKAKVYYGWALGMFACGLMSKTMVVTLPVVMLLLDWWPLKRVSSFKFQVSSSASDASRSTLDSLTLDILAIGVGEDAVFCNEFDGWRIDGACRKRGGGAFGLRGNSISDPVCQCGHFLRAVSGTDNLAKGHDGVLSPCEGLFGLGICRSGCADADGFSHSGRDVAATILLGNGLVLVCGDIVARDRFDPRGGQARADRYTYVPLIGVFIVLVWGTAEMVARWRVSKAAVGTCVALLLGACAVVTANQLHYWRDSGQLFRHMIAVSENNDLAYNNLGTWLSANGRTNEAMASIRRALQINPEYPSRTSIRPPCWPVNTVRRSHRALPEGASIRP